MLSSNLIEIPVQVYILDFLLSEITTQACRLNHEFFQLPVPKAKGPDRVPMLS